MNILLRLLAWTPLPLLYVYGDILHFFTFYVFRWRVDVARRNLAAAFPEKPEGERESILRQNFRNLARTLMEAIWGSRASGEELMRRVAFENPEVIEKYKAAQQSVVLLTAHTCNWEWLLLAAGARFGIPIDAVYKTLRLQVVDAFTRDMSSRFGGNPIPFENFVFELLKRAGQARAYGLLADQTPVKRMPKYWTKFLNQDTAFFLGPERIARYLDAPGALRRDEARRRRDVLGEAARARRAALRGRGCRREDRRRLRARPRGDDPRPSGRLAVDPQQVEVRAAAGRVDRQHVRASRARDLVGPRVHCSTRHRLPVPIVAGLLHCDCNVAIIRLLRSTQCHPSTSRTARVALAEFSVALRSAP